MRQNTKNFIETPRVVQKIKGQDLGSFHDFFGKNINSGKVTFRCSINSMDEHTPENMTSTEGFHNIDLDSKMFDIPEKLPKINVFSKLVIFYFRSQESKLKATDIQNHKRIYTLI